MRATANPSPNTHLPHRHPQFYSTLTVKDDDGNAVTKTISVNDPLRYGGITMYQVRRLYDRGRCTGGNVAYLDE